jgi:hypothetical protein
MAIRKVIEGGTFGPEQIAAMTHAYEAALVVLRLTDRDDPVTELIAKAIIDIARTGERDPVQIAERAIRAIGIERPIEPE